MFCEHHGEGDSESEHLHEVKVGQIKQDVNRLKNRLLENNDKYVISMVLVATAQSDLFKL